MASMFDQYEQASLRFKGQQAVGLRPEMVSLTFKLEDVRYFADMIWCYLGRVLRTLWVYSWTRHVVHCLFVLANEALQYNCNSRREFWNSQQSMPEHAAPLMRLERESDGSNEHSPTSIWFCVQNNLFFATRIIRPYFKCNLIGFLLLILLNSFPSF